MQTGERQHCHTAHRVAHQNDRAAVAGHRIDHSVEVLTELVDRGVLRVAAHRAAVAALVEEDQPAEIGEITPLVMPGVLVERVPMDENDGEVCVSRPVHLDVEVHTVVGDYVHRLATQTTERLVSRRVRTTEGSADRVPLDCHADRSATRDDPGGRTGQPGPSTHVLSPTHLGLPLDRSHLPSQRSLDSETLVSCVRGPLTVARGPLDDWQGRREPGVLEVRGRPRTQPGASGTGPTQRDPGHRTLESAHVCAWYARADPGDDLVRDRVDGPCPVLGRRLAAVARPE